MEVFTKIPHMKIQEFKNIRLSPASVSTKKKLDKHHLRM